MMIHQLLAQDVSSTDVNLILYCDIAVVVPI